MRSLNRAASSGDKFVGCLAAVVFTVTTAVSQLVPEAIFYLLSGTNVLAALSVVFCADHLRKAKTLTLAVGTYYALVMLTDWAFAYLPVWLHVLEANMFGLFFIYQILKSYDAPQGVLDGNVCILFYKPKTFFQYLTTLFGCHVASVAMYSGGRLYSLKRGKETVQELNVTTRYILQNYLVVNTNVKSLSATDIDTILAQRARQPKTLYLRYNCLRVFKDVLDKRFGVWRYRGEVLPSIYLMRRLG